MLLQVFVFGEFCVAPQVFDVVEFPCLPIENMHDRRETVKANPPGRLHAFDVKGRLPKLFFKPLMDIACDGLDLGRGVPFADDEKIRRGIIQFPEVEFYNVFSFDVLNAVDDEVVQRFNGGEVSF